MCSIGSETSVYCRRLRILGFGVLGLQAFLQTSHCADESVQAAAPVKQTPDQSDIAFGIRVIELTPGNETTALLAATLNDPRSKNTGVIPAQRSHDLERTLTEKLNRAAGLSLMH